MKKKSIKRPAPPSWKPRAYRLDHVDRFCSAACGRHCTSVEQFKATTSAEALARRLGKGWTPFVWENLGWHYRVVSPCKRISVNEGERRYGAFLGDRGEIAHQWSAHASKPELAVARVIRAAKVDLAKLGARLEGL